MNKEKWRKVKWKSRINKNCAHKFINSKKKANKQREKEKKEEKKKKRKNTKFFDYEAHMILLDTSSALPMRRETQQHLYAMFMVAFWSSITQVQNKRKKKESGRKK